MESIEHPLGAEHLAGCVALSRSAHWNQNEADWRLMLEVGYGWGVSLADGGLIASTLVLPYGGEFAWISMVLVHPQHRRRGHASRLLRTAIADLEARSLTPILDATPAGRAVYSREGFGDRWGFRRFFRAQKRPGPLPERRARALRDSDWPWILELDREAFGASREPVLRDLQRRLPQAALVLDGVGFVFGRDGREAAQLGPLVCRHADGAGALLSQALAALDAALYIDVVRPEALGLEKSGFEFQRPFTRMVRAERPVPGKRALTFLVAGPELG
jgi:GNAT superfamily N-acetyltransferase